MVVKKNSQVLASEVMAEEVQFDFKDVSFVIPPAKTWDIAAVRAQEKGQLLTAVEILLGDSQLKAFNKLIKTAGDFEDFVVAMYDAIDADPKE